MLNLRDTEMDQLADFLGHDIRVHRKFYRLPEGTLQLAKISKVLMALEQGRVSEFKGKNLDEINLESYGKNTFFAHTYSILTIFSSVTRSSIWCVEIYVFLHTFLQRK